MKHQPSRAQARPPYAMSCMAVAMAAILAAPAAVQGAEGQYYLAPGLQWMKFDDNAVQASQLDLPPGVPTDISYKLSEDIWYYAGFGYDLTDRWSFELSSTDLDPRLSGTRHKIDIDHYKVDALYGLGFNIGPAEPFLAAGVGHINFEGESDTLWDFGIGLKWPLTERMAIRTTARSFMPGDRDSGERDYGVDLSLIFYLNEPVGGYRETGRQIGSGDSDRDGVPNNRDQCPDTPRSYAVDEDGCPIPVAEVARMELLVNFDFDRAVVKPEYMGAIGDLVEYMEQYPDRIVELEGHTDSTGPEAYNQDLSERRANAVREVMINRYGIAASRVTTTGYGESNPVASNNSSSGRAQNRRVITVVIQTRQNGAR